MTARDGKIAIIVRNPRKLGWGTGQKACSVAQTWLFGGLSAVVLNWEKGFVRVCPKGYNSG